MGIEQIITDDLTGERIDSDTTPTTVRVDGEDYDLYLSADSKETFMALLKGEAPLLKRPNRPASATSSPKASKGSKTETYGYEYADVKAWAIANGIKAANGNPIKETTPRIGQSVYDAYHEAQQNA